MANFRNPARTFVRRVMRTYHCDKQKAIEIANLILNKPAYDPS